MEGKSPNIVTKQIMSNINNKMDNQAIETIELTWRYSGPCPDQWFSYFYNRRDNKTYSLYIRQDSCCWSADIRSADGCYDAKGFEELPSETVIWEDIRLAFDYLSDYMSPYAKEDKYFKKIVEEIIMYLNHRFPYFKFDSQKRDNFDFMGEISEDAKEACMEVLSRRAKLMQRYLVEYEKFLNNIE